KAVLMGKHGLVTWGNTAEECYNATIDVINEAARFIESRIAARSQSSDAPAPSFGSLKVQPLGEDERRAQLVSILPVLRGAVSRNKRMILHVDDSPHVLEFVGSNDAKKLALTGAACPDHLVHTKYLPLFVD